MKPLGRLDAQSLRDANPGLSFIDEALLDRAYDLGDVDDHELHAVTQGVVISTRFRGLVDRYINEDVGDLPLPSLLSCTRRV